MEIESLPDDMLNLYLKIHTDNMIYLTSELDKQMDVVERLTIESSIRRTARRGLAALDEGID